MTPKTGTRRKQAKAETRRLILDAAYELFAKKGYEKTTMRALAAKAGVGLGTIFQHFPDKSALLLAAFNEDLTNLAQEAFATLPQTNLREQAVHLVRPIFEFYAARPQLAKEILKEGLFLSGEAAQKLMAQEAALSQQMAGLIKQAIERGELRPDVDLVRASSAFWAYYFFVLIMGLRTGRFEAGQLTEQLMALLDQFLEGISLPRAPK
jgi:AcrR family transcriptional regulator